VQCVADSQNGRLLVSLRSRCTARGQEVIDPDELPVEFFIHSVPVKMLCLFIFPCV